MSDYLPRYKELFACRGEKVVIHDNQIFRYYNKMAISFGPVKTNFHLNKRAAEKIRKDFGALLTRWTDQLDKTRSKEWYAVICNEFIPIENLKSKLRNQINKGLNSFEVKRVPGIEIMENGYGVYCDVIKGYNAGYMALLSEEEFKNHIKVNLDFEDLVHFWGVYENNKLIGYAFNYLFDKIEVAYTTINIMPSSMKNYPSYALIYKMNEYYLKENGFEYVNDGFRSILHETNIQDFLIQKFNFRKAYCNLNMHYNTPLGIFIKVAYPFKNKISKFDKRFEALFELESIRRNTL